MSGNAILNENTTIWAIAQGGTPPYNFTFTIDNEVTPTNDFVNTEGYYANEIYAGSNVNFSILGKRNIAVQVTDQSGNVATDDGTIRVHLNPISQIKVNIAIEKGLLYLMKNAEYIDVSKVYWDDGDNSEYIYGSTASCVLAFEENGHLAKNNFEDDPYSDLINKTMNYILTTYSAQITIQNHSDGLEMRNSDLYNQGQGANKGSYLYPRTYANALGLMAVILSQPNATEAQNSFIENGYFTNWSYYNFIQDAFDLIYWNQGDNNYRGSWRYYMTDISATSFDGSTQQWLILALKAAEDRWGLIAPQWVIDNAIYAYEQITSSSGGCGYTSSSDGESGKTGGMVAAFAWANKNYPDDSQATLSVQFLSNNYWNNWNNLYVLYAVKKGLEFQGIDLLGPNEMPWYDDMTDYLLSAQQNDGSWQIDLFSLTINSLCTAHSILVLTKAITTQPPVALVSEITAKPINTPFQVDGSNSFHTDLSRSIIKWEWDFNNDGLTDAYGQRPENPGYSTTGQKKIALTVTDDGAPPLTDTDVGFVNISSADHPPVAIPIPESRLPCYAGRINQEIIIDGTESFDPDQTQISDYYWDLDGDGNCNDQTSAITSLIYSSLYNGQIGLTVSSNGSSSAVSYVDIIISDDDLYVGDVYNTPLFSNETHIDLLAEFVNDATSMNSHDNVLVRLYDENPLTTGNRFGDNYYLDLNIGESKTINEEIELFNDQKVVYIWLDADQKISEWNENNNIVKFNVITFGVSDTLSTCQGVPIATFNLIENDYTDGYTQNLSTITRQPDCGNINILDEQNISFTPQPNLSGFFDFDYQTQVFDNQNNLLGFNETTAYINLIEKPHKPFSSNDTIICPVDSVLLDASQPNAVYFWSTGDTTSSILVGTTGVGSPVKTLWVNLQNDFGCEVFDTLTVIFDWTACTAIDEIIREYFNIYPNPVIDGKLFINVKKHMPNLRISLYDEKGTVRDRFPYEYADFIDVSMFPEGMYFLNLKSDEFDWFVKIMIK